ncbi:peptidoglycan DD-metalloendopeptidase family protein [Sandaracinobacteroides saxicola]|uniref:Peptidoglycan DD-metalloendopeptidase family protein n=1 Tax=Sandaracinobacteroides saxicola TaxID=2759707 RepID=A0A7G5IH05_9SPHN|nr:peptidoglycan DD-metalloendopeptidase family protein [Sandaracinobacteroides saxicola]QMW22647.1 peptidoglycan DD-metalloendopeptidase family protein [Sandaracinobacteroides saxicola]
MNNTLLCGGVALCAVAATAQTIPVSTGLYRIPYADGTEMKVNRDEKTHTPIGRYDLVGKGGSEPYRIVAAAPGTIRFIEDSFSAQIDSDSGKPCTNNYVWIEHANGEWSKYSHMRKDSTKVKAGRKVGDVVKAGDYLGDEGKVGCAGGDHLHFEVGVPRATDPITTVGGFLQDNGDSKRNRRARICSIPDQRFVAGNSHTARKVPGPMSAGSVEVARHGLPIVDYQCLFDQAAIAGYQPVWLDMTNKGGDAFVNAVFRPATAGTLRAYHGLDADGYQAKFDAAKKDGFRPVLLESYRDDGVRYAALFRKVAGPGYRVYHGKEAAFHQNAMDNWKKEGFVPVSVSVVDSGGRRYSAIWEKRDVGAWTARSQLTPAEYQAFYDENSKAGKNIAYVNGYRLGGAPFIVAIANAATPAGGMQRHGLTNAAYQDAWEAARKAGLLTRGVAGYETDDGVRYVATWRK